MAMDNVLRARTGIQLEAIAILERAFAEFRLLSIAEEECEIHEGTSHGGMSAVINATHLWSNAAGRVLKEKLCNRPLCGRTITT
jgi:hypothetical protein